MTLRWRKKESLVTEIRETFVKFGFRFKSETNESSSKLTTFFLFSFIFSFIIRFLSHVHVLSSTVSISPNTNTQDRLCSVGDILDGKGGGVYETVDALLSMTPLPGRPSLQVQLAGFALFYLSVMSALCAIYVHLAPQV